MTCPTPESLHSFLDGVLPAAQADPIAQHLPSCRSCTAEAQKVQRMAAALAAPRRASSCLGPAKIALFATGQLDETTRAEVFVHLGRCRKCADALMTLRKAVFQSARPPAPVPSARPAGRPSTRTAPRLRGGNGLGWVAAAAIVLAALGAWVLHGRQQETPQNQEKQATNTVLPPKQEPSNAPPEVVHVGPSAPKEAPPEEPQQEVAQQPPSPEPPQHSKPPEQEQANKPPEPQPPQQPPQNPPAPTAPKEVPYQVSCVMGPVEVQPSGKTTWQPLKEGQPFDTIGRATLRAGGSKCARVACAGTTLNLDKGAEVTVVVDDHGSRVVLVHGGLLLDSHGVEEGEACCEVAGAPIAAKGKRLAASLSGKQGKLIAVDGELTVDSGGKSVTLAKGLSSTWTEGKPPSDPAKADIAGSLSWERELEVFLSAVAAQGKALPPMKLVPDSRTTGGSYATTPARGVGNGSLEFSMEVKRAATYRLLARATTGERAKGAFAVSVDGGAPREMTIHGRGDLWMWSPLEGIELAAGPHTIRFTDKEGGLRLDAVTLTTDTLFRPEPMGEDAPAEAPPAGGPGGGKPPGHANPGGDGHPGPGGHK